MDPVELSIITGSASDIVGEKLAVIHEDDKESSLGNTGSQNDSANSLALEDKLSKELPKIEENEGQTASRTSTKTCSTMVKPTAVPVSSVSFFNYL